MGKLLRNRLMVAVGAVAAICGATWALSADAPVDYVVDLSHTSATFRVQHMGISWVAGRFDDIAGRCVFDKADPAKSSFEVTIKTGSIDTNNAQRDEHLRGEDFFNTKQYPTMTFKSTSVKKSASSRPATTQAASKPAQDIAASQPAEQAGYEVAGDFTMHGVTRPLTLILHGGEEAELPAGTHRIGFFGEFSLKRSDYGMNKLLGGVGDDVKITVSFEAIRQ
jgi:polyisoprenoid-binding protein YceI